MMTMILGLFSKFKSYVVFGGVALLLVAVGLFYFHYSQNKIADLNKEIATLTLNNKIQQQVIKDLDNSIAQAQRENDELNKKFEEIEKNASKLNKFFSNHDLDTLAKKEPGMIELRVNNAVKKLLNDLEVITSPRGF